MPSRRQVLAVAGTGIGISLSGCANMLGSDGELDLVVANYRDTPVDVTIALLAPDDRDGEPIHKEQTEIPTMAGEEDLWRRDAVAPSSTYRIKVVAAGIDEEHAFRYEPTCSEDEVDNLDVRIDIYDDDVRFYQPDCSGGGFLSGL